LEYGSIARGEEHAGSDIDLMVVRTAADRSAPGLAKT
jgi:predicted nucleotidyltransferase